MNITVIQAIQTFSTEEMDHSKKVKELSVPEGCTISELIQILFPNFIEFERPTVVLIDGVAKMREAWKGESLKEGSVVLFLEMPQFVAVPYVFWLLVVASIAIAFLIRPAKTGVLPEADSVYNIRGGRKNQIKLGSPIEVSYGRCRLYPSYASAPYNEYENNEQYLYALYCLGQGEFEIERHQIDDTDISDFSDVSYQVYAPGEEVRLIRDNVTTSIEVNNIELLPYDDPEHTEAGPFVVNEAGTTITTISIDVSLPGGLYATNSKGKMVSATSVANFVYAPINDSGEIIGGWQFLTNFSKTMCTNTPQRFTISKSVDAGRYMVKGERISSTDPNNKTTDTLRWEALRGYKAEVRTYPGVTTVAVKMKASYQLNDTTATTYNVWATRKLPVYNVDNQSWSAPVATRSPMWAMCDIFRSKYGGRLSATKFDLAKFTTLADKWEEAGRHFDYTFDQKTSVWEAAKAAMSSVRSVPVPLTSLISVVEDTPHTIPTALFAPHNMVEGSFKWKISMPKSGDYTGVRVTYINPDDFLEDTLDCLDGDDTDDNLEEISLVGQTDKIWAYRDGLYMRRQKKYIRETFSFTTGLEGHLPLYGALIGISHDIPEWSSFGLLLSKDGPVLEVSEPVSFVSGASYVVGFRLRNGSVAGPYAVHEGLDTQHIILDEDFGEGVFIQGPNEEPPLFLFGATTSWAKMCIVSNVEPNDDDTVTIEAYSYVNVFQGDTEVPEEESGSGSSEPTTNIPDIPVLNCSSVYWAWSPGSTSEIYVTWSPTLGAWSYDVEYKTGVGSDWTPLPRTTESSVQIPVENDTELSIRVRPIGKGVGEWCTHEEGVISSPYTLDDSPVPGTYDDLNGTTGAGTPEGSITAQARGGSWTLVGYEEYIYGAATLPPPRYRRVTAAGSVRTDYTSFPPNCATPSGLYRARAYAGTIQYDAATGARSGTVIETIRAIDGTVMTNDYGAATSYRPYSDGYSATSHTHAAAPSHSCYSPDSGGDGAIDTGTGGWDLADPDSSDAAISRLLATSPAWTTGQTAIRTIPTTGITGVYREARYRTEHTAGTPAVTTPTLIGLTPWQRYRVTVALESRPVDETASATGAYAADGTRTHYFVANLDGEAGLDWQTIEPRAGYETRIASSTVEAA